MGLLKDLLFFQMMQDHVVKYKQDFGTFVLNLSFLNVFLSEFKRNAKKWTQLSTLEIDIGYTYLGVIYYSPSVAVPSVDADGPIKAI